MLKRVHIIEHLCMIMNISILCLYGNCIIKLELYNCIDIELLIHEKMPCSRWCFMHMDTENYLV